ncbi:MAG: FG-GAP-like repeat-containing protein [Xanthomonadales bacterium]|nr:FG-GAP-like repeat-containing protein [Xanthomonadales bacterium]
MKILQWVLSAFATLVLVCFTAPVLSNQTTGKDYINPSHADRQQELIRLRSELLAHYENGFFDKAHQRAKEAFALNSKSAVEKYNLAVIQYKLGEFGKSKKILLELTAPGEAIPQAHYLLGLTFKQQGEAPRAFESFLRFKRLMSSEPAVYFQLALLYRERNDFHQARQALIHVLQIQPDHQAALYQLAQLQRQTQATKAQQYSLHEFSRLKASEANIRNKIDYDFANIVKPIVVAHPRPEFSTKTQPRDFVFKMQAGLELQDIQAFSFFDKNRDGIDELIYVDRNNQLFIYYPTLNKSEPIKLSALPDATTVFSIQMEYFSARESARILLLTNQGVILSDALSNDEANWQWLIPINNATAPDQSLMLDIDHDGDLDILFNQGAGLWRNKGNAAFFHDDIPFWANAVTNWQALYSAALYSDYRLDIIGHDDSSVYWLKDGKGGQYKEYFFKTATKANIDCMALADLNNDGLESLLLISARHSLLTPIDIKAEPGATIVSDLPDIVKSQVKYCTVVDINNDGWKDVLLSDKNSNIVLMLNQQNDDFRFISLTQNNNLSPIQSMQVSDYNADGALDVVLLNKRGQLHVLLNQSEPLGRSFTLNLQGQRSPPSGRDTLVDIRRGSHYARYRSKGSSLHIGLGNYDYAEVLRLQWTNGFIENKLKVDSGRHWSFLESERISGSCPTIFSWNGEEFEFVTDAFISGPMGVPISREKNFPVDHDEYIKISETQLREENGLYQIRITEELREAVFLDQVRLLAVDYPESMSMYPNERLAPPPFPEFSLHFMQQATAPFPAIDQNGKDVSRVIAEADGDYAPILEPMIYTGLARENSIEFSLSNEMLQSKHLRLFLTGWFYYFDSTSMQSLFQRDDLSIVWPQVQALMPSGEWKTLAYTGIPPGKRKTVVVDLSGKLPDKVRKLRVWSNIELYWDQILIDISAPMDVEPVLHTVPLMQAALRFRGFSEWIEPIERSKPEIFNYQNVTYKAFWNPLKGSYTRYGNVEELLAREDSLMVVMGSGDEVVLSFSADIELPKLGWRREFLLYLNGFVKDGDKYTASDGQLAPLPYAGMTQYPYPRDQSVSEIFSRDDYREYIKNYQTRKPLTFTGPSLDEN